MTVRAGAAETEPTHHASLTDGTSTIGFIFCDGNGQRDIRAIRATSYPRQAMKTSQGESKYSDLQPPYFSVAQDDWSSGRGNDEYEKDTSRYYDGYRVETGGNGIVLGGQESYARGHRNQNFTLPGSVTWVSLTGTTRYLDRSFTPSANYSADKAEFWVRRVGTPNSGITVLLTNSDRSVTYKTIAKTPAEITSDIISVFDVFDWTGTEALTSGTTYRIQLYATSGSDDSSNHWEVGCDTDSSTNTQKSTYGTTWTNATYALYFRVTDADAPFTAIFFEYKGQLYYATRPDAGGGGKIYMNGSRGAADSNTGVLTRLKDATQTGWAASNAGQVAVIWDGDGNTEQQNWRRVTGGGSGYLTVDPAWNQEHNVSSDTTVYNVVNSDTWTVHTSDTALPVQDVAVTGNTVWIARGESKAAFVALGKFWEYVKPTRVWTKEWVYDESNISASFLKSMLDPVMGHVLWIGKNWDGDGAASVTRALVPSNINISLLAGHAWVSKSTNGFMTESASIGAIDNLGPNEAKITLTTGAGTGIICTDKVDEEDWRRYTSIGMYISSTKALAAGELQLLIDNTAGCASPIATIDFPAMQAWRVYNSYSLNLALGEARLDVPFDLTGVTGADKVVSVGFKLNTDPTQDYEINIQFVWVNPSVDTVRVGDPAERITGLERYGDPENLWVLKEGSLWSIENLIARQIPLREMESMKSLDTGRAHWVRDVYMMFSMANGSVEKYFRQNLDDMGPNRDAGLPSDRQGVVVCGLPYPGRDLIAINGKESNYSSVLSNTGSGWHEVYRTPRPGIQIRSMYLQSIPGQSVARLWISQGSDIVWVPISLNPYNDSDFRFTHEGHLITSYIHANMQDVRKLWKSIKIFMEQKVSGTNTYVQVDYRMDSDTSWTSVTGTFDSFPSEEIDLSTSTPPSSTGRRIQFRIRLYTKSNTNTPKIRATVIEGIGFIPVKYQYSFAAQLRESDMDIDLDGEEETTWTTVESKTVKLLEWANNGTALTWRCNFSPYDNKTVYIDPPSMQPIYNIPDEQVEQHLVQITAYEA